jgi:hypothetical protein
MHRSRSLRGAAALAVTSLLSLGLTACFGSTQSTGSGGSRGGPYAGPVTVRNESSHTICRMDVVTSGTTRGFVPGDLSATPLAPGASTTVNLSAATSGWLITGCDQQVLFVGGGNVSPAITLRDGSFGVHRNEVFELEAVALSTLVPTDQMGDDALRAESLSALQAVAQRQSWREAFQALLITDTAWSIVRHRLTGFPLGRRVTGWGYARWPAGYCTFQQFSFRQEHDGSDFSGAVRHEGTGPQFFVPCEAIDIAASNGGTGQQVMRTRYGIGR